MKLGEIQLRAGKFKEAEATYREALAERPGSAWAARGLAKALEKRA
ncbi:tetratricopeptide repeat protein [Caenimonas koreensis]